MSEIERILEQYLKEKFRDKTDLSITRLDKLTDGWESDNYLLTVEYGSLLRTRVDWVWRIYSGAGSQAKARREFNSMEKLLAAGYPVPRVILLEAEHPPVDRPLIIMEYIQGEVMWGLLGKVPADKQAQLLDQFCRLLVQLHNLDWKQFDDSLPDDDLFFFIDQWLDEAPRILQNFPEVAGSPFLEWVAARRALFACARPLRRTRTFIQETFWSAQMVVQRLLIGLTSPSPTPASISPGRLCWRTRMAGRRCATRYFRIINTIQGNWWSKSRSSKPLPVRGVCSI